MQGFGFTRKEHTLGAGAHEPKYENFHGHNSLAFAAIDGAIDEELGEALSIARHCKASVIFVKELYSIQVEGRRCSEKKRKS